MTTVKKRLGLTALGVAAACAACCAPLLIGPGVALLGGAGIGFAVSGELMIAGALLAAAAGYVLIRRLGHRRRVTAAASCDCPPETGCTPDACALPAQVSPGTALR